MDSSFAYQAYGRNLGTEFIGKINAFALENFLPDATVFIDLTPEEAFVRKHGADENDRLEQAGMAFHNRVYQGFDEMAKANPDRFIRVDGRQTPEAIFAEILQKLKEKNCL